MAKNRDEVVRGTIRYHGAAAESIPLFSVPWIPPASLVGSLRIHVRVVGPEGIAVSVCEFSLYCTDQDGSPDLSKDDIFTASSTSGSGVAADTTAPILAVEDNGEMSVKLAAAMAYGDDIADADTTIAWELRNPLRYTISR